MSGSHEHHHHGHDHDHGLGDRDQAIGHEHRHHGHSDSQRRLFWVALLTGGFMLAELVGGLISGSLALIADAGHMLADVAGLVLAWLAFRVSRWPADPLRSYGFDRLQILVAFGNGLVLIAITAVIVYEAIRRFFEPVEVLAGPMLWIAVAGGLVNLAAFAVLHGADSRNLNMRGALLHVAGDLFGSAGAIGAALIIMLTGWTIADPLMSLVVAAIILRSAWALVRDSAHILLEGAPAADLSAALAADLPATVAGVREIHHVHVWSLTEERPMVTLHAVIGAEADGYATVRAIKDRLRQRFGITHATVEVESDACADGHPIPSQ